MVVKDDRIVLHETVGWNDRERQIPLNRNSYYRIRSMTKPVVGTAVLMLVEDGKVGLDDLASQYLPSFDNERSGDITVRQLLRHQAGYEQTAMPNGYWRQGTLREAVDLLGRTGPAHPPADVFRYSDKNPAALGAIIAEVTGAPAERFIQSRIFEPLGLSEMQTRFSPNVSWASRMNSTYRRIGDLWVKYWNPRMQQEFPFFRGSGGIHTTISEYARFLTTWMRRGALDGVRLIDEATVVEALRSDEPIAWGWGAAVRPLWTALGSFRRTELTRRASRFWSLGFGRDFGDGAAGTEHDRPVLYPVARKRHPDGVRRDRSGVFQQLETFGGLAPESPAASPELFASRTIPTAVRRRLVPTRWSGRVRHP